MRNSYENIDFHIFIYCFFLFVCGENRDGNLTQFSNGWKL